MGSTLHTRLKRVEARVQPASLPCVILYYATEEGRAQAPAGVRTALFPVAGETEHAGGGMGLTLGAARSDLTSRQSDPACGRCA